MISQDLLHILKIGVYWAVYIALASTSFFFIKDTVSEYRQGKTGFLASRSPMTGQDIPTFTICFQHYMAQHLKYGRDFGIYFGTKFTPLEEGKNEIKVINESTHHLFLRRLLVDNDRFDRYMLGRKCIKVSPTDKELDSDLTSTIDDYQFAISFWNKTAPKKLSLYMTTEENAYGATLKRWQNGKVEPFILRNNKQHYISLDVSELHFHHDLCQEQSYYQCLGIKVSQDDSCKGKMCSIISLPTAAKFKDMELNECTEKAMKKCNRNILHSLIHKDVCATKACLVREYKAIDYAPPTRLDGHGQQGFYFQVLMTHQTSASDHIENKPFKSVFTEYYLLNGLQLIGTIGGTLGLMIGFSFMGFITSFTENVIRFYHLLQRQNRNDLT